MTEAKLNLGAGAQEYWLGDYVNIDGRNDDTARASVYPLADCWQNVDTIRASHILEHFPKAETVEIVKHWVDRLKPGGWLKIAVPDFEKIAKGWADETIDPKLVEGYLLGGQTDSNDYHKAIFTENKLRAIMEICGLENVSKWSSRIEDCASLPISLNLAGMKPIKVVARGMELEKRPPAAKVKAVMSVPRLGFMDNFFCAFQALLPLKIPISKHTGAYWEKSLTNTIEAAISEGAEYILTIDYDSVFTRDDVEALINLMMNSDADAIAPIQSARHRETPLLQLHREDTLNGDGVTLEVEKFTNSALFPAKSAHFGLTLIKVSALQAMPRPWFQSIPDEAGRWSPDSIDADVYFWRKFAENGLKLTIATGVIIGHLELGVIWPGQDLKPVIQTPSEFYEKGKPTDAWQG